MRTTLIQLFKVGRLYNFLKADADFHILFHNMYQRQLLHECLWWTEMFRRVDCKQ